MSKKITLENVDSSELPEIPVIGEVKQIRFTQDMELVSTLADSDLFMVQVGADLEARPNTITFDLIIKNLSGPIEEGSKKFVTGDMMFKVIGDMNLLDTWDNTNIVSSLNATYVNVRRIEEELRREINRSTGKDEQHDEQIANLRQDLTATNEMLNQEINRSVAKDNEHDELLAGLRDDVDSTSEKLDAEIDRSTAKDAEHDTLLKGLRVDVNANKSAIDSEVARSTARDEAHDAAIAKNASDITTEVNRAKAEEAKIRQEMQTADTNLQNAITAETERATGVEEDLQQQITDLSGSTDDRLEALEALSHEQNTDTGTTSKTFTIDSGNTGVMLKAEGGGLSTRTKGDAGYANFTVQNLVIKGDVTQEGDTFITQAERVEVRDNMILINEGETGAGVTAGFAGIEVDRGTEQNFMFGFNESDGMFKIGKEGNMFDVALRQPVGEMTDGMFASWDAATKTFKTTNLIPPTLQLYLGVPGVSVKYVSSDDGSIKFMTNGKGWSTFTGNNVTCFRSDVNNFQFIGDVSIYSGKLSTSAATFNISVAGGSSMVIDGTGSTLSTPLTATSFFRASDKAEVMYATDSSTLTDGMFLSWDKENKKVVTTNLIPPTLNLYLGTTGVNISYNEAEGGSIRLRTNGKSLNISNQNNYTNFRSTLNKFQFIGDVSIYSGKLSTSAATFNISVAGGSSMVIDGTGSTLSTPLTSTTYYRSSDDSEVLYQADLKSVLTGKETNYAPTVKAVSDAIDAVNTGTTESLKNYLPLAGGTMTGSITMPNSVFLKAKNVGGTAYNVISVNANNNVEVGNTSLPLMLVSSSVDIIHYRDGAGYKMWDIKNLPDPATKSGNNAFTGTNSFVGGKFSVAGSESEVYVSAVGNLVTRSTYGTTGWTRSLEFSDNDVVVARFGVKAVTTNNVPTTNFVGILVGNGTVNDSQYKFSLNKMEVPSVFILSTANGVSKILSASSGRMKFGDYQCECYLESKNVDLIHNKNNVAYKIWDASNLPDPASTSDIPDVSDMARRSEANTFTASNTFTAGQFNVGAFEIDANNNIFVNISQENISQESGWARELVFINSSSATNSVRYGVSGSTKVANYAYIGIGDVDYDSAQYKFTPSRLIVPATWSLIDEATSGEIILFGSENQYFGRNRGTTYIRSGNTDLYHTKVSTSYKILDESNYSQYLPTTSKWTYGFVHESKEVYDLNTDLVGPDKGKLAYNYTGPSYWTNGPTGMDYGTVIQIWGSGSPASTPSLMPQLAFDVNHNVANSTRYMWFRTANNLGYGDSSNWKRVVTADEKPAGYVLDENSHPALKSIEDGTTLTWLRAPQSGFIPFTAVNIANGGSGSLGTSTCTFKDAYIANVSANRYLFGNTGVDFRLDTNNKIAATISGSARGIEIGDLLVSSNYGADAVKVPTNGIFSSGRIQSNDSMLVGYSGNVTEGMLGYGLYYDGTFAQGLGSEYSSGALVLYKMLNPNKGKVGYNVPRATTGIPTYLKIADGRVRLGFGVNKTYTAGEEVTVTEHTLATLNAVNKKLKGYLPLTGGTVSGSLSISPVGSAGFAVNNADTSGVDVFQTFCVKGANKFLLGWSESGGGAFIQRSDNNRCMVLMSDGLYTGSALGSTVRVATLTDLGSYATQSWVTSQGYLTSHQAIYALTFAAGAFAAKTFTPTSSAVTVNVPTKTSHLTNDSGFLTSVPSTYATQSWVTSQGYLTSITKSMVTTALGYTPPTTNTTYSQATSSTLGLVKIGATGLASKNYAVQLNSSGQMYVAVPWTDTDTNTHYTTRLYAGARGTAANSATTSPYIKVTDDNTYRNQIRLLGGGATSVSSDASGNITITSTNTTYGLATASSNGLMSSSQYTKLSNCIETVSATNMVTSVQVVDTIPATSSQVTGRLYLKFA